MSKIEKLEYDENRVKMHGPADVIKEMIAKMNEIIDVVSKKEREREKKVKNKNE